jgi:hypothetical protein
MRFILEMVEGTEYQVSVERIICKESVDREIESSTARELIKQVVTKLKLLIEAFPDANLSSMTEQCRRLDIQHANAKTKYNLTVQQLFHDGITWGRVTLFYAFSVGFLVHVLQRDMGHLVNSVLTWSQGIFRSKLNPWIEQSGGWENFLEFANRAVEGNGGDQVNGLGGKLLAAAAVLGIAALAGILVGRGH